MHVSRKRTAEVVLELIQHEKIDTSKSRLCTIANVIRCKLQMAIHIRVSDQAIKNCLHAVNPSRKCATVRPRLRANHRAVRLEHAAHEVDSSAVGSTAVGRRVQVFQGGRRWSSSCLSSPRTAFLRRSCT